MSHQSAIGRWAVCSHGQIGKITDVSYNGPHMTAEFYGHGLDEGQDWQSSDPRLLSIEQSEFIDKIQELYR